MAQVGYRQLANGPRIACENDLLVHTPRSSVRSRDVLQRDSSPGRGRHVGQGGAQLLGTAPEGHAVNAALVQPVEVRLRGELRVKDQCVWQLASALLPRGDKLENLVIVLHLAQ